MQALEKVGAHLKEHGPFLGGETPNAADASLAPQLYHAKHALKHFKARPVRWGLGFTLYIKPYSLDLLKLAKCLTLQQ